MTIRAKKIGMFLLMAPAFLYSGSRELLGLAAQAEEGGRGAAGLKAYPQFEIESLKAIDPRILELALTETSEKLGIADTEKPVFTIENGRLKLIGTQLRDLHELHGAPSCQ